MTCPACADLCQHVPIRSPRDLWQAIKIARQNVDDGTIVEFEVDDGTVVAATPIGELSEDGIRPDVIKTDFFCNNCRETFHLICETYHGSGGSWSYGVKA
jgi:hypothetical protein